MDGVASREKDQFASLGWGGEVGLSLLPFVQKKWSWTSKNKADLWHWQRSVSNIKGKKVRCQTGMIYGTFGGNNVDKLYLEE